MNLHPVLRERWAHVFGAVVALLMLSGLVAVRSSTAAFSATTNNTSNSWTAGTVTLTDDDSGTAMYSASGMVPGVNDVKCITVSYSGTVNASVKLYGAVTGGTGLGTYLNLTVERGTGGSFGNCTGFSSSESLYSGTLAGFVGAHTNFGNGVGTFAPVGGAPVDTTTYRFTVSVADNNLAQGLTATAAFTWEAQNT